MRRTPVPAPRAPAANPCRATAHEAERLGIEAVQSGHQRADTMVRIWNADSGRSVDYSNRYSPAAPNSPPGSCFDSLPEHPRTAMASRNYLADYHSFVSHKILIHSLGDLMLPTIRQLEALVLVYRHGSLTKAGRTGRHQPAIQPADSPDRGKLSAQAVRSYDPGVAPDLGMPGHGADRRARYCRRSRLFAPDARSGRRQERPHQPCDFAGVASPCCPPSGALQIEPSEVKIDLFDIAPDDCCRSSWQAMPSSVWKHRGRGRAGGQDREPDAEFVVRDRLRDGRFEKLRRLTWADLEDKN